MDLLLHYTIVKRVIISRHRSAAITAIIYVFFTCGMLIEINRCIANALGEIMERELKYLDTLSLK